MTRRGRRPLLIGAVVLLCMGSLAISVTQISRYARFGTMRHIAAQIERDRPVSRELLEGTLPQMRLLLRDDVCQSEFVKAAVTVALVRLDTQSPDVDYDNWSSALGEAENVVRFAVHCLPSDGNFWVRYAMVRQAVGEQPEEIAKLVTLSQLYAPAEENTIAARFRLYNRLTQPSLTLAAAPLKADLAVVCSLKGAALRRRLPLANPVLAREVQSYAQDCQLGRSLRDKTGR